jgi:hypothetical protein
MKILIEFERNFSCEVVSTQQCSIDGHMLWFGQSEEKKLQAAVERRD